MSWFGRSRGTTKKPRKKKGGAKSLDVRARRRVLWYQRFNVIGRLVVLTFSLTVMGWAGWKGIQLAVDFFLLENQAFALRRFELSTNGRLAAEQVLEWADLRSGDNVLALDLAEIKRNLEMVPMIHEVAVERVIPDRVKVRIKERRPVFKAYFLSPGKEDERIRMQPYMIDEYGFVLAPPVRESEKLERQAFWRSLPELTGLTGLRLVPGESAKSLQVTEAIRAYLAFRDSSMVERVKIRSLDVSRKGVVVVRTSDQQEIILGRHDLAGQFRRWELMLDAANRKRKRLVSLDLSVKNNHPFVWEQQAREEPRAASRPSWVRRTET